MRAAKTLPGGTILAIALRLFSKASNDPLRRHCRRCAIDAENVPAYLTTNKGSSYMKIKSTYLLLINPAEAEGKAAPEPSSGFGIGTL